VVRTALAQAGIPVTDLRVRDLGAAVRLEVPAAAVPAVAALRGVRSAVSEAGFSGLDVEVSEFRSGRLNED
jgi:uncharacterized protein